MAGPYSLVAAVVIPLAVSVVLLPARGHLANTNVALLLVAVVVAVAAVGHRLAGAVAALSAAAWFDFFFTRPYERFSISDSSDLTTAVLLLAVGLAVSQLAARARRFEVIAVTDTGYLARIHHAAVLARSKPAPAVVDHVRAELVDLLVLRACRFEDGSLLGHPPRLEHDGSIVVGRKPWPTEDLGMPAEDVELRVFAHGRYVGRFMLTPVPGSIPDRQALLVAVTLADQAGAALETATGHVTAA
ncbi:histidine kinase [Streptomyces sp. CBMA123]|nr:histidine kinase [Streptomyces sp. CBMA123]